MSIRTDSRPAAVTARGGAAALLLAGALFVLYPATRPYSDLTPAGSAPAFASGAWLLAHLSAVVGFVLLPLGLLAVHAAVGRSRTAGAAFLVTWFGVGLVLPYYGAEAFALNATGERIGVGLLLLAVGTVLTAVAVWRSGVLARWAAVPMAAGFVLFLPQFYAPPALRIAHGVLVGVGCVVLALQLRRSGH